MKLSALFMLLRLKKLHMKDSRGVTAIELIVVIAIFGILASTILFRFSTFNLNVHLDNVAQDIALRIHQAENASINGAYPKIRLGYCATGNSCVSQQEAPVVGTWTPSYGIYFDITATTGHPKQLVYFFDRNNNGVFDDVINGQNFDWQNISCGNGFSECIEIVTIPTGEYISNVTGYSTVSGILTGASTPTASIVFKRPFPDATISDNNGGSLYDTVNGGPVDNNIYFTDGLSLTIQGLSTSGQRTIKISPIGQISVIKS